MAATLTDERFTGPDWTFERKLDGIRLLAYKDAAGVRLFSRNRLPQHLPAIAAAIGDLACGEIVLDGEVTWGDGATNYHVFDIMWLDGADTTGLALEARRELLTRLPLRPPLHRVPCLDDERPWDRACREGWEGVIAKRRGSCYEHRRSPHWLKMKCEAAQEFVVGGFTDPQGARVGLGALLVGCYDGDDLVFAGKIGTGFDNRLLLDLRERCNRIEIPVSPFTRATGLPRLRVHWVRPEVVVQVAFLEWTVNGKLRHPRLLGVRDDKAPRDVVREQPVITHPDKLLFPDDGINKGELAGYYEAIAPLILPHISRRPITMERYPQGIAAKGFWQKDVSKGFPEWLERVDVPKKNGVVHHALVTDTRSLLWMVNQNTITPHVWVSRAPALKAPDLCVFDLDPADDEDPAVLRSVALALRDLLRELSLKSWVKTSGSKGFHIVVPLDGTARTGEVARFADAAGTLLVRRDPRHLTREFSKADRGGRILVDTGRNGYTATFAAPYAVRAKTGAPVSAPCTWDEVEQGDIGPRSFTLRNMAERVHRAGDLWSGLLRAGQPLGPAAQQLIDRLQAQVRRRFDGLNLPMKFLNR